MAEQHFDLIVIGGGPGGYVAAIRAAQLGMKVACVDRRPALGGTCLNVGCIPSKALLHTSERFAEAASGHLAGLGIKAASVKLDLKTMMANKDAVVAGLTGGIDLLFAKNKVTRLTGEAHIPAAGSVEVAEGRKKTTYSAERILIATGSAPASLPGVQIDEKTIVSSTGALALKKVPEKLAVIGAGYIGLELGTVWARLGAEVQVIEYLDRILPGMDGEVAEKFQAILEKQGLSFQLATAVQSASHKGKGVELELAAAAGGKTEKLSFDVALVAVGRKPHTEGLGLEGLGVALSERGQIEVDEDFETSVPGIFAIGDVIAGPMLAHKAEEDGVAAVEIMAGKAGHVDYDLVPGIVYTSPEVAQLGETEEQLKQAGTEYKKGVFPFMANSRARATGQAEGFVKLLAHKDTDQLLGAHIIGPEAGTLIHEIVAVMAFGGSAEDVARSCHGHPTLSEAVKEAALAVDRRAIHS